MLLYPHPVYHHVMGEGLEYGYDNVGTGDFARLVMSALLLWDVEIRQRCA